MNNMKKLLSLLLAVAMILSMAACQNGENNTTTAPNGVGDGKTAAYTVTIQTAGKLPLQGISVQVYEDDTLVNLIDVKETNAEGKAVLNLPVSDKYAIVLGSVPAGYKADASYKFSGSASFITLISAPIDGESMSGASFEVGDVIYDFEFTDTEGNTRKISDILKEKKMILLNFFFTTCGPCASEVPYMEEAYQMYKDDVEVIALNPYGADDETAVAVFKSTYNLSFPMAKVPNNWASMASGGYPTNYVIDRYGVITLIELGGLTSLRPFTSMMEYFTAADYQQKLCFNGVADIVSQVKPTVEPETPDQMATTMGNANGNVVFGVETENEYSWPFVTTEKNGEVCLKSTNANIEGSHAIMYMDVTLKKGEAFAFDYLISSEAGTDLMHVIVDDVPIFAMSGVDEVEQWKSCYPWVAQKDGTYKVVIAYIKDDADNAGDDTAYIKNVRIVEANQINVETFLPVEAAVSEDGVTFEYADIVYNEKDGYYHVGSANGPLLLANLMGVSQFDEENSIYIRALDGEFGETMAERITPFASYAANSKLTNYCTVNKELAELLKECVSMASFDGNENEWLKLCKYYAAYGSNGKQMPDPIEGLATFSAPSAQLGMNEIPYLEGIPIMPRGKLVKFVPAKSGVYRITSHDNGEIEKQFLSAWIFNENHEIIHEAVADERNFEAENFNYVSDITMTYYMEAGTAYYIDIAYWDPYTIGSIPFEIEYLGASKDLLVMCSPGPFTYNSDETGDAIYDIIHGFFKAVLNPADGYYYEDLGKDANGNQIYGSVIYADFTGNSIMSAPIADYTYVNAEGKTEVGKGLISLGGFEFVYSEDDQVILFYMNKYTDDNDQVDRDKVEEALLERWGQEMYNENESLGIIDDVFNGIYHGTGADATAAIQKYLSKMIKGGELDGCVKVDEELATLLQQLMDKYTFAGVDQSWLKMCYYYKHLGA